jgi:hypothetical protein
MNWESKRMKKELELLGGTIRGQTIELSSKYEMLFPSGYPFKPPILLIHKKDHCNYLCKLYTNYYNFLRKYHIPMVCNCEHTIASQWVPCYTGKNLWDEYNAYLQHLKQIASLQVAVNGLSFDDLVTTHICSFL